MSRTYRRKTTNRINWACDLEHYISEHIRIEGTYKYVRVPYPKASKAYKKGLARYHSDGATNNFKEPGPSWFRNLFSDRPLRRKVKNELRKFMISIENVDNVYDAYEPNIPSKGTLPYWT